MGGGAVDVLETLRTALADRYAIERELGQGGMATVYLAEDLKHHRKVALKVLRPELAITVGAARFAREIEVAARLQHPHILPLLDSGEAAGFFFYVMPFVQGESLRDRLARGGELPIQDAVRILMEVADALSHAHANGVVHRDIKPDNVLLTGRHALVADFGVAKAVSEATGQQMLTSTGIALGTPAYMAPEQAAADKHQDHRVDIYALGVLGYELLTGRMPFTATTVQEMLAAHLTAVPDPVERYRAAVSPALAAVVMKCLAKKPADRWQTADEVQQRLEPLATPSGGTTPAQTVPTSAAPRSPRWAQWVAGVGALAMVALVAGLLLRPKPLTVTVTDATAVTSEPGIEYQPSLSPDGKEVAFLAGPLQRPHLVIRGTASVAGGGEARPADSSLLRTWQPTWSPDGDFVRFVACRVTGCAWAEVGKLGGAVRPASLPPRARSTSRLAWSPDGGEVAFAVADAIVAAPAADTTSRRLTVLPPACARPHSLAWSPDGRMIAFVCGNEMWLTSGNLANSSIWLASARGGPPQRVTAGDALNVSPAWLDARHLLFVSDRDGPRGMYLVEVGPKGSRGEARAVPGVPDPHAISVAAAAGRLAFARFTYRQNIRAYPLDRPPPVSIREGQAVTSGNQVIEMSDPSPDGRWLAFDSNVRSRKDLYRIALAGGAAVSLTSLPGNEEAPRWSPDGREVAFHYTSQEPGSAGLARIMVVSAEGGPPVAVTNGPGNDYWPVWSPNGLAIAYASTREGSPRIRIAARDSVGGAWRETGALRACANNDLNWAPDGSGVLCDTNAGVVLYSLQGRVLWRRDLRPPGELTSYTNVRLSRDGRTIYTSGWHRDGRAGVWAVPVPSGPLRLVVAADDPALEPLSVSLGRDRLYLTVAESESDIWVAKLRW